MPAEVEEPPSEVGSSSKRPKIETVQRRRAFHARLVKFAATHSEVRNLLTRLYGFGFADTIPLTLIPLHGFALVDMIPLMQVPLHCEMAFDVNTIADRTLLVFQEDDVPQHPMPERTFNRNSASAMPVATTCIPMEIVTTKHRMEVLESHTPPASSTHFSRSFKTAFSLKTGKLATSAGRSGHAESSPICAGLADTILPMPINRTPHRDTHTHEAEQQPLGTPHLPASFSPFFSVKRSSSDIASSENLDNMPAPAVQLTPLKRRHAGPEGEEPEIVAPVELQTPIKVVRTYGTLSQQPTTSEWESPSKRPHFSPAFKPHFSVTSSPMHPPAARSLLSTPVTVPKEVPISWDVRTPGRISDMVERSSPIEEECAGMKTPVKSSSSIPAHSFKSPAPTKHQYTPCTPRNSESGESPVNVSYQQPGSACLGGFNSPAATPVKAGSSIRSLNFASPKRSSAVTAGSPCPCSPSMDVPSTPGMQTPVNPSRASRFRNKVAMKHSKLNLGPLFAQTSDDDADAGCREDGEAGSHSCVTGRSSAAASGASVLRKSLSFASEVSEEDMSLIQGLPAHLVQSVSLPFSCQPLTPLYAMLFASMFQCALSLLACNMWSSYTVFSGSSR